MAGLPRNDIHGSIPPNRAGLETVAYNTTQTGSTASTTSAPAPVSATALPSERLHSRDHLQGGPDPVPEMADPQQAATAPGTGGVTQTNDKLPFKEAVNGYAKKFAGTVFGNKEEKEFGEAKLRGQA